MGVDSPQIPMPIPRLRLAINGRMERGQARCAFIRRSTVPGRSENRIGGEVRKMKRTSSKTAVTLFDLAMLASIGLASAGAFYGILRIGIWLAVQ
jgi:hypothetical protein